MITQTPDKFLCELADVVDFIPDLLGCPKKAGWHLPSFYLLYVEVDRLSMLLLRLGHMLEYPITPPGLRSFEEVAEDIHGILENIAKRQKTIVGMLWLPYRVTRPTAAQRAIHDRVGAHIHPKSGWYQTFMLHHGACEIRGRCRHGHAQGIAHRRAPVQGAHRLHERGMHAVHTGLRYRHAASAPAPEAYSASGRGTAGQRPFPDGEGIARSLPDRGSAASELALTRHTKPQPSTSIARVLLPRRKADGALARRNFLFVDADSGGERAAAIYSLIGTAKINGIPAEAWLCPLCKLPLH